MSIGDATTIIERTGTVPETVTETVDDQNHISFLSDYLNIINESTNASPKNYTERDAVARYRISKTGHLNI